MSATATEFSNVLVNAKNDIFQGTAIKHLVNKYKSLEECLVPVFHLIFHTWGITYKTEHFCTFSMECCVPQCKNNM